MRLFSYILMFAVAVIGSNSLLLSPILADIASDFSVTAVDVAWAITAYNAATAVSALLLARFIDVWGIRAALMAAYTCLSVGTGISAMAWSLEGLLLGQILAGLGAGVSLPAIYALAPMIAPKGNETKIVGRVLTGWSIALVAGIPISAYLTDVFGWRSAYYLLFGLSIFTLALITKLMDRVHQLGDRNNDRQTANWNIFAPFTVAGASPILFMNLLYMTAFYGTYAYIGTYLKDSFDATTIQAGYAVLAYGIGFGLASFADPLVDKLGIHKTTGFIFVVLSLTYLAFFYKYDQIAIVYAICLGWGFLNHLGLSAIITLLGRIDTDLKGQLMGMNSVFTYAGGSAGTFLFGIIYIEKGFYLAALLAVGMIVILTIIYLISVKKRA